jgi:hypothetical protein
MLSSNIKLEGFISLFISYWLPPMTMDAVLATIIAGGQARIRLNTEVSRNKLISTLIYGIFYLLRRRHWNEHAQGRPPLRRHGFIKSMPLEGRAAPPPW